MPPDPIVLKKGSFYRILDGGANLILEDATKRELAVRETGLDRALGVDADAGTIYDMDGIGHRVAIRWFFPKERFALEDIVGHAEAMDERYARMRELACPD